MISAFRLLAASRTLNAEIMEAPLSIPYKLYGIPGAHAKGSFGDTGNTDTVCAPFTQVTLGRVIMELAAQCYLSRFGHRGAV